ncbi:tRNA dimethylallyltransferase, mitochondrial [Maublancomyces gigas]|uniref:tRNA dimethylallyltransferase, mitochondrial n=1 Tax=Discina gigas TaxID=1032678 RepID=A0ABR3GPX1_9PEZI
MTSSSARSPLITVIGATGTGKSNVAVDLALALNGEIINGDAMQMYEGLPIITNKITKEEMCGVPHHLLGFLDVKDVWRVGKFVREAESIIEEIRSRGRIPILVGGTHYYIQSLLFPYSIPISNKPNESQTDKRDEEDYLDESYPFPSVSGEILEEKYPILNAETPILYETLQQIDPTIAAKWHPNDRRKILRSLQIYYASNCTRTASEVYAAQRAQKRLAPDSAWTRYKNLIFWVHAETDTLKNRLDGRVDKMIGGGMWEEIKEMKIIYDSAIAINKAGEEGGVDLNSGIWQSIGFKEFLPFLEMRGKIDQEGDEKQKELEEVKRLGLESMKTATRQYARSQVKWIRIKFLNALGTGEEGASDTQQTKKKRNENGDIFLLDSTDITSFSETVSSTAVAIAKDFLSGSTPLPDPLSLSPLARTSLLPKRAYDLADRPDLWIQRTCELCGVICTNADEWRIHAMSQRHKKTVSREKRRPEVDMFIKMRKDREEDERRRVVGELVNVLEEFTDRSMEKEG